MKKKVISILLLCITTFTLLMSNMERKETVIVPMETYIGSSNNEKVEVKVLYKNEPNKNKNIINKSDKTKSDKTKSVYSAFTQEEINLIWRVIETETYQAGFKAKCNVASVILNRVKNKNMPNDVISVITDENQFVYGRTVISEDTKRALEYVFSHGEDTTNGALAFHSNKWTDTFCGYKFIFTDEAGHHYYGEDKEGNIDE